MHDHHRCEAIVAIAGELLPDGTTTNVTEIRCARPAAPMPIALDIHGDPIWFCLKHTYETILMLDEAAMN